MEQSGLFQTSEAKEAVSFLVGYVAELRIRDGPALNAPGPR